MALHEGNTYRTIRSWLWRHILVGYLPEKKIMKQMVKEIGMVEVRLDAKLIGAALCSPERT